MSWFNNLSIKRKLILLIFAITLVAQILAFSILTIERAKHLKNDLLNQSHIQAKLIGEYCVSPLVFEDMDGLKQLLQKIEVFPFILSVAVYDQNGKLVSYHQKKGETEPILLNAKHDDIFLKNMLHIREAIIYHGIEYGQIHLRVSTEQMRKEIFKQILLFAYVIFGMLIFIYFLANRFQRIISKPILNLAEFSDEISRTADYSLQIQKLSNDEIGTLYENFNNMIRQINKRQEEKDKADEALQKSQKLLNETQRLAKVGGWEYYPQTQQLTWTDEVYRIYGLSKNEYNPSNLEKNIQFYTPEDQKKITSAFQRAIEKGESYDLELQFIKQNETKIWVRTLGQAERDDNKIIRVFGNIANITVRKQAEQELRKYRDHLEELVKERTAELEEKNKKLEKFNDLFVNREFRIKELKDKLKEFEKKK